jgi:hypothetical protein
VTATSKVLIFSFFLLVTDQALVIAAFKFGLPIKPSIVYALISLGLLLSAGSLRPLSDVKWYFLPFAALVLLCAVLYRGEGIDQSFDAIVLRPQFVPSNKSYALWSALNLIAAAGLFLLARRDGLRRTIVLAVFTALTLQVAAMEADMWWFAIFGDPNGRAGGLAQNANIASLLVVTLAALTLSTRLAPYAVALATAGTLLSQSKTGTLAALVLIGCFIFIVRDRFITRHSVAFAIALAAMLTATTILSPVLNPSPELVAWRETQIASVKDQQLVPMAALDRPIPLEQRLKIRTAVDESASLRWHALQFYTKILIDHPAALLVGMGTGFTNRFATGPHDTFLKLAVDNGIIAALILLVLLANASRIALRVRTPELVSLTIIAWIAATFYHTMLVDPIVLPVLAIALGLSHPPRANDAVSASRAYSECSL